MLFFILGHRITIILSNLHIIMGAAMSLQEMIQDPDLQEAIDTVQEAIEGGPDETTEEK